MASKMSSLSESSTIRTLPPKEDVPSSSGRVIYCEFGTTSAKPLRGGVPLSQMMRQLEADPEMAERFAQGRRALAENLSSPAETIRSLRLKAGLSQVQLAEGASATQSYIARLEAGTLDPGTDMLARLAAALALPEIDVFCSR